MADVLLLEGGDELLLENGVDSFLLEEPPPTPPTPPPPYSVWEAGSLTVPSSPGTVTVTGLGGEPQLVLFYSANWLTEDATVSTSGTALMRGMACPRWDFPGTVYQHVGIVGPTGDQHATLSTRCITQVTTAGTASGLYQASFVSFNSDGFTVDFDLGASGGYKVVWCAMYGAGNVGAMQVAGSVTETLGWKAGSMVMNGNSGGSPSFGHGDRTLEWFGSAAYPGTSGGGTWYSAGLACHALPPASGQYETRLTNDAPGTAISTSIGFVGPAMNAGNVTAIPDGVGLEDFAVDNGHSDGWSMSAIWDDEDSETGRRSPTPANTGNTASVSLPFDPGLVIGYSNSDEPNAQGSVAVRGAIGLSVASETFQWAAIVDGVSSPRTSFQSFQRGFADMADGGNVHAGTVTLQPLGFELETFEDDAAADEWVWHAFGHPRPVVMWVPHIYRRVLGT